MRAALSLGTAVTVAAAFAVSAQPGLTSAHSGHAKTKIGTLTFAGFISPNLHLANTLDPAQVQDANDLGVIALVNQEVVIIDDTGRVVCELCTHWTVSPNHKVYTFYMRKAHFSNGDKVTAADAVASIREALAAKTSSPVAYYDQTIAGYDNYNAGKSSFLGVKALSGNRLQVTTSKPVAYFLKAFTYITNTVLDQRVVKGINRTAKGNALTTDCQKNVGAGPFKFQCQGHAFTRAGASPRYLLVPNPHYFGPKPHVNMDLLSIGTSETAYNEFLAGKLDAVGLPSQYLSRWQGNHAVFHAVPTSQITYDSLNTYTAPFNNVNCRLAWAWGINRNTISTIVHHEAKPLYTIVPPSSAFLGHWNGAGVPHYNLAKAQSYFAKCPGGATAKFQYDYPTGSQDSDNWATAEVGMLQKVGFKGVTPNGQQYNDWANAVGQPMNKTGTIAVQNGWIMDYPDSQDYVSLLFQCHAAYDITGWCNSRFDKLTTEADSSFNSKVRARLYEQAQKIALNSGMPVQLENYYAYYLRKASVKGYTDTFTCGGECPKDLPNGLPNWAGVSP